MKAQGPKQVRGQTWIRHGSKYSLFAVTGVWSEIALRDFQVRQIDNDDFEDRRRSNNDNGL